MLRSQTAAPSDAAEALVQTFLRWTWSRAVLHRGWWLVTSVYLVLDAGLSGAQLVLIGVAQGVVGLTSEIPAGVVADTISRKWALVVSHVLMGSAMLTTGLVTAFPALLATQMLWGLSWAFASGADVAWITDELDDALRIPAVLVRAERAQLTGAAAGIVTLASLATLVERRTVIVGAGAAMLALGLYVVARFREHRFVPAVGRRWTGAWTVFVSGATIALRVRAILLMVVATCLVNGATVGAGRLQPLRLIDLGLPTDAVIWFAGVGVLGLLVGATTLRIVESTLRGYATACALGALGVLVLAAAPEELSASAGVVLVAGIAVPVTRVLATVRVNRETPTAVRATVHSFLAQAEYVGEIVFGIGVAVVARAAGISTALAVCAALFVVALVLVRRD